MLTPLKLKMFEKINQFRNHRKKNHVRLSNIVTVQRSNKAVEALHLPKILNLNPRSAMNKIEELQTFIEEQNIDCAFISESHETENKRLEDQIKLEDYVVISNVNQRLGKGGRPALIVNKQKYDVQNITNSIINLPWGVEITWALLTPKHVSNASIIQHTLYLAQYIQNQIQSSKQRCLITYKVHTIFSTQNMAKVSTGC